MANAQPVTCQIRYTLDLSKLSAFESYARTWIVLIERYGGTHHGYFNPRASKVALVRETGCFIRYERLFLEPVKAMRRAVQQAIYSSWSNYRPLGGQFLGLGVLARESSSGRSVAVVEPPLFSFG